MFLKDHTQCLEKTTLLTNYSQEQEKLFKISHEQLKIYLFPNNDLTKYEGRAPSLTIL